MYLPDLFGKHYGLVTLQCNASDWNIVKDEFLAALNSTRMQRAPPPKEVTDALKEKAALVRSPLSWSKKVARPLSTEAVSL